MTEFTRAASWDDVKNIATLLNDAGVEYALVGGYAISAHGFIRMTEDIDILVEPSAENSRRWILALSKLPDGAAKELLDEPDIFKDDTRHAVRINDDFTIDVMPSVAGHGWQEMKAHVTRQQVDEVSIPVLDLPGLLKTKQGVRPKDIADAAMIRAALERLNK